MFREGWIVINSLPTHVMTWGGWVEDDIQSDTILVCIPGNPGITDFYFYFLENLHKLIGIPIWIVNHAGNEPIPENCVQPSMNEYPEFYDLSGQIEHKRKFLKKYVPEKKKLILIGHSVGGKMCVELMKDEEIASKASQVHLMFPTLQHICQSPNGKVFVSFIQYVIPVIVFLSWLLGVFVPRFVQYKIVSVYFRARGGWKSCHRESCLRGTLKLFTADAAKLSLTLAKDEMYKIKDLDTEVYEKYGDKMFCYFAKEDRWAPLCQYHHLIETHPKVRGAILDDKFTHAFVLTTPVDMAQELSKSIIPNLSS